jgi:hypothetical protein
MKAFRQPFIISDFISFVRSISFSSAIIDAIA